MEVFKTPFTGLMGLINNQILRINERMIKEIMDSVPLIDTPPVGRDADEFFESSQLPWRTEYTSELAPRYVPQYARDPATRNLPPPPVPDAASENLESKMSLLELQESSCNLPGSPHPTVLGINTSLYSE